MNDVVYMFPGVGSHYTGMGKQIYEKNKVVKDIFQDANDILNIDFKKICFDKSEKKLLDSLLYSQLSLFIVNYSITTVFQKELDIKPSFCIGHSLGEINALCSAGVVTFQDALRIVKIRSETISEVIKTIEGTMAWVINIDNEKVEEICNNLSNNKEQVYISAYDSPSQCSISGNTKLLFAVAKQLEKEGAIVYPLNFNGPFHCPLMKEATIEFNKRLTSFNFVKPLIKVISNYTAKQFDGTKAEIISTISNQLMNPIKWHQTICLLESYGIRCAIELGPKNVLKFLLEKNTDIINAISIENHIHINDFKEQHIVRPDDYLKIIGNYLGIAVSTKNNNLNTDDYHNRVIESYRKIEKLYQTYKTQNTVPSINEVKYCNELLNNILEYKKVLRKTKIIKFNKAEFNKLFI